MRIAGGKMGNFLPQKYIINIISVSNKEIYSSHLPIPKNINFIIFYLLFYDFGKMHEITVDLYLIYNLGLFFFFLATLKLFLCNPVYALLVFKLRQTITTRIKTDDAPSTRQHIIT